MGTYIFIDESGQFSTSDGAEYFLAASFTVGDPRRTQKAFKSWRSHFPKKMWGQAEIKWTTSSIDSAMRLKTLRRIADLDVRIRYVFLKKKNIPPDQVSKAGLLYTNIIGEMLETYLPSTDKCLRTICDQRKLPGLNKMEFKNLLRARLLPQMLADSTIEIEMIDSTSNTNIQIADWIAGGLAHFHEKKNSGEEYFAILKNNILEGKELFKNVQFGE